MHRKTIRLIMKIILIYEINIFILIQKVLHINISKFVFLHSTIKTKIIFLYNK